MGFDQPLQDDHGNMGRISTAFRAFFRALFDAAAAARLDQALAGTPLPPPSEPAPITPPKPVSPRAAKPAQSEALTLLSALQREARLIDFLQEDLKDYTDEQVGAAVREVQRDCAKVLERLFAFRPVLDQEEGTSVELPADFDAGRVRLTGKVAGAGPYRGTVRHHGWEATKCELPNYTGSDAAARTVAPAEVEVD
jgi:hypothetical protein